MAHYDNKLLYEIRGYLDLEDFPYHIETSLILLIYYKRYIDEITEDYCRGYGIKFTQEFTFSDYINRLQQLGFLKCD